MNAHDLARQPEVRRMAAIGARAFLETMEPGLLKPTETGRHNRLSPEGRARIRAAAKRRWANFNRNKKGA